MTIKLQVGFWWAVGTLILCYLGVNCMYACIHIYIWASLKAQLVKNLPAMQETLVWFLGQKDPLYMGFHIHTMYIYIYQGFPGDSVVKNLPANAGDVGSTPGLERSPGGGNGDLLWYPCLGNPMDRGVWRATVHGVTKSWTQLSDWPPPQNIDTVFIFLYIFVFIVFPVSNIKF